MRDERDYEGPADEASDPFAGREISAALRHGLLAHTLWGILHVICKTEIGEVNGFRGVHHLQNDAVARLGIRLDDDALEPVVGGILKLRECGLRIEDRYLVRADLNVVFIVD